MGVEIGDVKEAAQTRLDVLTAEQEASVRRTLTLHRAAAAGEPPPSTPDSPSIAPVTTPQLQQAAPQPAERPQPAETLEERREAAVARRREMRQPPGSQPATVSPPDTARSMPVGQQSVLGNDFATNRTLSMEMPSFDKGAKAGPMTPPPAQSDLRQTALEPPPEPRRTRSKPPPLKDSPAESRKPPPEQKAKGTTPAKRSKPRQAPPLAKPPKKAAAGKSRDTMPAAMRRMLRGL